MKRIRVSETGAATYDDTKAETLTLRFGGSVDRASFATQNRRLIELKREASRLLDASMPASISGMPLDLFEDMELRLSRRPTAGKKVSTETFLRGTGD